MTFAIEDAETAITDWRLSVIEGQLREAFAVPDETRFASFVQPPKFVTRGPGDEGWLPPMAVFIVQSPHPTNPKAPDILTHGTVEKKALDEADAERKHFVSFKPDPALIILSAVLKNHLTTLQNLREIIH